MRCSAVSCNEIEIECKEREADSGCRVGEKGKTIQSNRLGETKWKFWIKKRIIGTNRIKQISQYVEKRRTTRTLLKSILKNEEKRQKGREEDKRDILMEISFCSFRIIYIYIYYACHLYSRYMLLYVSMYNNVCLISLLFISSACFQCKFKQGHALKPTAATCSHWL